MAAFVDGGGQGLSLRGLPIYIQNVFHRTRRNARTRRIPFGITMQDFRAVVERAAGHCEVTGIEFDFDYQPGKNRPFAPSLDRIDSALGYVVGNVRLVCGITNTALSDWGMGPVLDFAQAVVRARKAI